MRNTAGPELAARVSQAGGLGIIGPSTNAAGDLEQASELVKQSKSTLSTQKTLPVGIGFLLWSDDLEAASTAIKTYQPSTVWLFAPSDPSDLEKWTLKLRQSSPDTKIWIQIGTIPEAKQIRESQHPPDAVVIQGAEAGGHGRATDGMGLMTLLPEISDILSPTGIPLLGAGGIADSRGAAAAFCLGASGVVMGTRFLASTQIRGLPRGYQREVVNASDGARNTTRTLVYNHLQGVYGWPAPFSPRVVLNRTWEDHCEGVEFGELKRRYDAAKGEGDAGYGVQGRLVVYAGAGIGLVGEVRDAGDIVEDVRGGRC